MAAAYLISKQASWNLTPVCMRPFLEIAIASRVVQSISSHSRPQSRPVGLVLIDIGFARKMTDENDSACTSRVLHASTSGEAGDSGGRDVLRPLVTRPREAVSRWKKLPAFVSTSDFGSASLSRSLGGRSFRCFPKASTTCFP